MTIGEFPVQHFTRDWTLCFHGLMFVHVNHDLGAHVIVGAARRRLFQAFAVRSVAARITFLGVVQLKVVFRFFLTGKSHSALTRRSFLRILEFQQI